ncbi:MAG: hypothetical protein IJX28_06550 [Clostridia bacterium]|nr:hypothetical protein [Clostridia bacterium]
MKCYYGEVHAHSTESDGKGTVSEAYTYARDVGHADYFATTDHNLGRYDATRVAMVGETAESFNEDGKYAALYGYEMTYDITTGHYGHINILQPTAFFPTSYTLDRFYDGMAKAGEKGIGQFNHPGDKWGNFNEFVFDPRVDDIFRLMELRITEYGITCIEEEYDRALRMGWHISPVSNEDAHNTLWTTNREEIGGVLAESLTRENILEGMRKNRTFATTDRSFQLYYKANGEWIGSRLKKTGALKVEIDASTEKACGLGVLQLVGEHNRVLAQVDVGQAKSYHWEITIPDDQRYTYVKRISGMHYAISGAVWVEQNPPLELEIQTNYQDGKTVASANVKNIGDRAVTDLVVEWYPACASIELGAKPFVSRLGALEAGASALAGFSSPVLAKHTRLVAIARGVCNGEPVTLSRVVYLSPLTIQRFFCNSRISQICDFYKQPFCCYDVYNNTDVEIDASEYTFRYYIFGTHKEFTVPRKIAPHGMLTIWFRGAESSKTMEDFNAFYGTNLTENEVYCCPLKYEPDAYTRKLTIGYGDEVACRAWIRSDGYHGADVDGNDCFDYEWTNELATMKVLGLRRGAKPREFVPALRNAIPMPTGKALAEYVEPAKAKINRLVVLTDGCTDLAALESRARVMIPEAKEIVMIAGESDGTKGLHNYMFWNGTALLQQALDAKPDAVLVSMGGNDCGKKRTDWFLRNFVSFSTTLVNITRGFYVRHIPLVFTMPALNEEQMVDGNALSHMIKVVARTLYADFVGVPEDVVPASLTVANPCTVKPKADAIRIAVVGDQFSDKTPKGPAYAFYLQELLGDGFDVYLYAKDTARASKRAPKNYLENAGSYVNEMKRLKMDAVVSMFGCADLRHVVGDEWDQGVYPVDFEEGFREVLKTFADIGAKNVVVTPFDRKVVDSRQTVLRQEGGVKDMIVGIAKEYDAEIVDFFKETYENEGLIELLRDMDYPSAAGIKRLAEMVAEKIKAMYA